MRCTGTENRQRHGKQQRRHQKLAGRERDRVQAPMRQELVHVDVADGVADRRGQAFQPTGGGHGGRGVPRREDQQRAAETDDQPGSLPAGHRPLVPDRQRQDHRPQRCRRVDDSGGGRIDGLLGHREQQVRDRVGEQGRHGDLRPERRRAWHGLPPGHYDREQHGRAQRQPGEGHLGRGEAAVRQLDPEERGAPDERQEGEAGQHRLLHRPHASQSQEAQPRRGR